MHWPSLAFGSSVALIAFYELRLWWLSRRQPQRVARCMHARLRAQWVEAMHRRAGFEIVAVQALRNSLMSATIAASTSALALVGCISFAANAGLKDTAAPQAAIMPMLMVLLFASHVCSALAMRYFHHAGFVMSMPAGSPQRESLEAAAKAYVARAGLLYGWGLRCFLLLPPLLTGLAQMLAMPLAAAATVYVLWLFDRPGPLGLGLVTFDCV